MQNTILHSSIHHPVLRLWQNTHSRSLSPDSLVYPIFVNSDSDSVEEIPSMPNQKRYGVNRLKDYLTTLVSMGLKSVLLFGVVQNSVKDNRGSPADDPHGPTIQAIKMIRKEFPELLVCCDLCLCPFTSHGHCGILHQDGRIDNTKSITRLAEIALAYALAGIYPVVTLTEGCHVIAPSDMMDNRILAIKTVLVENNLAGHVSIMSYSAKFASAFYGPFRDAACSAPSFGDRKCYQLPPNSTGLAKRALMRDAAEGADILMVKPAYPYLDVVKEGKLACPDHPMAVYQVSGEYAMIWYAAQHNVVDLKAGVKESLEAALRAGNSLDFFSL